MKQFTVRAMDTGVGKQKYQVMFWVSHNWNCQVMASLLAFFFLFWYSLVNLTDAQLRQCQALQALLHHDTPQYSF